MFDEPVDSDTSEAFAAFEDMLRQSVRSGAWSCFAHGFKEIGFKMKAEEFASVSLG